MFNWVKAWELERLESNVRAMIKTKNEEINSLKSFIISKFSKFKVGDRVVFYEDGIRFNKITGEPLEGKEYTVLNASIRFENGEIKYPILLIPGIQNLSWAYYQYEKESELEAVKNDKKNK